MLSAAAEVFASPAAVDPGSSTSVSKERWPADAADDLSVAQSTPRTWHAPIAGLFVPNQVAVPTARAGSSPWCLECDEGLTGWGLPRTPQPQSAEQKGAKEHDNADEQQEQQALGDDAYDA
jgi:hypothetical protein